MSDTIYLAFIVAYIIFTFIFTFIFARMTVRSYKRIVKAQEDIIAFQKLTIEQQRQTIDTLGGKDGY